MNAQPNTNGSAHARTATAPAQAEQAKTLAAKVGRRAPREILGDRMEAIRSFLPDDKARERFVSSAAFAMSRNPKLLDCTDRSIQEAVCTAAELQLDFSPSLGLAYLVPYWDKRIKSLRCQLQIGYRGLCHLAGRSGITVEAHVVHEFDQFEQRRGTEAVLVHVPPKLGDDRGEIVGAYAVARFPDGHKQYDVMDIYEIGRIKEFSKSDSGPWQTDFAEMAKKTPTRRLCKYLNLNSPEMAMALEADNEAADLDRVGDDAPRTSNTEKLRDVLGAPAPGRDAKDEEEPPQQPAAPEAPSPEHPPADEVVINESDIPW